MPVKIIAAIGKNGELGAKNALLWNLPGDMRFFRETTRGAAVVMGRLTFESIGRPLPNRRNIVITRNPDRVPDGVEVSGSLGEALALIGGDGFVIGGARVYADAIGIADEMILTEIDASFPEADVFFPKFERSDWDAEVIGGNCDGGISYRHTVYRRKQKNF